MTETRRQHISTEVPSTDRTSREKGRRGPDPGESNRLLHLREIEHEFGLTDYQVYKAVHEGRLHALQRDGKGRVYYAEWEVRDFLRVLYATLPAAA